MHELAVAKSILNTLLEEAQAQGAKRVKAVEIVVGNEFSVPLKGLKYWMTELSRGTPVENARINFKKGKLKGDNFIISEMSVI